jgi:aldose 1-epimerase
MQKDYTENTGLFQKIIDGKKTDSYILTNKNGLKATISNYGARWVAMYVPDKNQNIINVITGLDTLKHIKNLLQCIMGQQ